MAKEVKQGMAQVITSIEKGKKTKAGRQKKIEGLEATIARFKEDQGRSVDRIAGLEQENQRLKDQIRQCTAEIAGLEGNVTRLNEEIRVLHRVTEGKIDRDTAGFVIDLALDKILSYMS
jgi:chromosome segregation ATPase